MIPIGDDDSSRGTYTSSHLCLDAINVLVFLVEMSSEL
jgi:hypothetical protein